MTKKFCLFFVFLLPCMAFGQIESITLSSSGLHGKVKTLTIREYRGISAGKLFTKGKLRSQSLLYYNKSGNKTAATYNYFKSENKSAREYFYDKNNFFTEEKWLTGTSRVHNKIRNNAKGKPVEIISYNEKGESGFKEVYRYNNQGLPVEITFVKEGKEVGKEKFTYNAEGNLATRIRDGEAFFYNTYTAEYDGQGNVIKTENLESFESSTTVILYKYNTKNLKTEQHVIRSSRADPDEEETTVYEYSFDNRRNWVVCIEITTSKTGKAATITEREIKYYD